MLGIHRLGEDKRVDEYAALFEREEAVHQRYVLASEVGAGRYGQDPRD